MVRAETRRRLLFISGLMVTLVAALSVILTTGDVQAFGSLTENGTAAFMGIGIVPQKILHVSGSGPGSVPLFSRGSDSAGFIIERTPTNRWVLGVNESPTLGNGFVLSTIPTGNTSVARLMITPGGRVGIGTVSPDTLSRLHVYNTDNTSNARAIYGETLGNSTYGVYGKNSGSGSYGYLGGSNYGTFGFSSNNDGVQGESTNGIGVRGIGNNNKGVQGSSISGIGVYGTTASVANYGVWGQNASGTGVYGNSTGGSGVEGSSVGYRGVYGSNTSSGNYGILADNKTGVYGAHGSSGSYGYLGGTNYGVYGFSDNISGVRGDSVTRPGVMGVSGSGMGVQGTSTSNNGVYGNSYGKEAVYGMNTSSNNYGFLGDNNTGAYGKHNTGYQGWLGNSAAGAEGKDAGGTLIGRLGTASEGVYGQAPGVGAPPFIAPWAGNFNGNVQISGGLNVMAPPVFVPPPGGMVSFFLPGSGPGAAPGSFIVFPPNPMLNPDPIVLNDNTTVYGSFTVIGGPKLFSIPDPADPSKTINYACVEGPEAGNYIRGSSELVNGEAVIILPEHFAKVTADSGLTVQLTPAGKWLQLYVAEEGTSRIVVREATGMSGRFHYLVQGVRKGYEDFQVMRDRASTAGK